MKSFMQQFVSTYNEEEKIWQGPRKKMFFNEEISVGEIALYLLRRTHPQTVMEISDTDGTTMTYGEILTSAIRIAQHLKKMKLTTEDVVGIFAPNVFYVTPVALAAWFNGTPFHATNCTFEPSLVKHIYSIVQPKVVFCDGQYYEKVKKASEQYRPLIYTLCNHLENVPKVEDLLEPTISEHFYQAQPLIHGPDQTMAIMVSSGTTGLPKGICVSNRACVADFAFCNGSSTSFSTSTLDWSTGFTTFIANLIYGGRKLLTTKPLTPEYLLDLIVKYKINFLSTNPEIMLQLSRLPNYNKDTMKSIRLIFMTGAFCSEANLKRMRSAITMGELGFVYGTTEFGGITCNSSDYKGNSAGKIVYNIEVKIIDPVTGERLGPNQIGEIYANHGHPWFGYYRNPEASKDMIDADNFIRTGDLGYIDEEHYLYFTGRSKDIMKYMGFQYSPQVIEDYIAQIPDVLDVCVFGVFDELKYDVPAAAIVKQEGSSLSAKDVIEFVRGKTDVFYKQIHYGVFFVKELPRNHNGKLMRNEIKEICLALEKH